MAVNAPVIQYSSEWIAGYEKKQSLIRSTTTTEAVINGLQATFLVADSGGASAVTRGLNGNIPARNDSLSQPVATLKEKHDLVEKTGFNIFQSQGDQKRIMMETSMGVINRDIDDVIRTELETGTVNTGSATTASLNLVVKAMTILGNNKVPLDGNRYALISPAFHGYLMQTKEFGSAEYVNDKPFAAGGQMFRWYNTNWIVDSEITGVGTNAEKCIMYHRSAIGHAIDMNGIKAIPGYDERQDISWARTTVYHGARLLQNAGVVIMNHDASGFAPA
jgi:hypothetical protein